MSLLDPQREKRRELYRQGTSHFGRKRVTAYDARQLREMLLSDHGKNRADSLYWMVAAVVRIAEKERKDVEAVWRDLNDQARAETGMPFSPLHA